MWSRVLPLLALGGCAQIFEIESTSKLQPDARVEAPDSAQPCIGGEAREVDPNTGACFMYFTTPMTRDAARSVCNGFGPTAHLAIIKSASENALITRLIGTGHAFIGASDEVTEGTFLWADGTPFQLTNWTLGEPNDSGANEDCVEIVGATNGTWNDVPCAPTPTNGLGVYSFVCQRD
jgi:hypothetical protein